jgi:hypothetical protein
MSTRLNMGQISGLTGSLTELESEISTEEYRVDSILSGSTASLDSFGEASVEISNIKNSINSVLQGSTSSMDTFSEVYNTLQSLENRINGMSSGATGPQGATGSTGATGSAGATGSSTYFKYLKNHYQTFSDTASLGGSSYTQAILTNTLMAFPIEIKTEVTIQSLRYVNVSGVAGNSVWGLYNSGVSGAPNNLLFQSSAFNNSLSSAVQTFTLASNSTLQPGIYWLVYNSSSAPTIRTYQVANVSMNIIGETNGGMFNGTITFVYRSFSYTGTLPSTFGSYLVSNTITLPPYVYFYIV